MTLQEYELIETPENVELTQRLAGIGTRLLAGIMDTFIIVGVLLLLVIILLMTRSGLTRLAHDAESWLVATFILIVFLLTWGYFVAFELWMNGQSPGKKRLKIRVVKQGGEALSFSDVAIRNLLRVADGMPLYPIAGLCMFITRRTQRIGDLAAGTIVISEESADYSAVTDKKKHVHWEEEITPTTLRATGLTPQEYRLLRNYWLRAGEMTVEARERLLPRLLMPILARKGETMTEPSLGKLEECLSRLIEEASAANTPPPVSGQPAEDVR